MMKATNDSSWKAGFGSSIPAAVVRTELLQIRKRHGKLAAPFVVNAAKKASSPLHALFEWDDTKAGHLYRLQQARVIIQHVEVEYRDDKGNTLRAPAFISVANSGEAIENVRDIYVPLDEVPKSEELTVEVLQRARRELEQWKVRYEKIEAVVSALKPVFMAIHKASKDSGKEATT